MNDRFASTDTAPAVKRTAAAFAPANGIELCFDTFGEDDAPPLLLIMGLAAQMIAWDEEFCSRLAARGYRVIRFDNRDIGLSTRLSAAGVPDVTAAFGALLQGKPVPAPYRLGDMAKDAVGLLDFLGIQRAHVVGASMGGAIAQTLAIEHAPRLRTLTSIMATTGAPGLPPPTPEAMAVLLKPTPSDRAAYFDSYVQTWKVLRAGSFPLDEARDLTRAAKAFDRGLNPAGVARQLTAILASGSRKAALGAVRVPTLVIHGDADPLVPLACGVDTAESVPGARLQVIEGMGHALPVSMWPQIIDAIAAHAV
jgi:pimeloyl-ACP methyl ester carboxylesterase